MTEINDVSAPEGEKLWGGETDKAIENFPVSGQPIPAPVVHWLGRIKAAAARYDFAAAGALISDDLLRCFAFAGTPQEVADHAAALFAAGAGRVEFGTPHGLSAESGLRLLGERVVPALRVNP